MKIDKCPSCTGPIERTADGYFCPACDCTFKITREGPKVVRAGELDALKERVKLVEEKIGGVSQTEADPDPAPDSSLGPDEDPADTDEPEQTDDEEELWPE